MKDRRRASTILRLSIIGVLVIVVVWKFEIWTNPLAIARNAWHLHVSVPVDFFQEWASAKNFLAGEPIYSLQPAAYVRYFADLGFEPPPPERTLPGINTINAHPPSSVLLFVLFARATYVGAFRIWSLLSALAIGLTLWLVRRELGRGPFPGFWALVTVILVFAYPLREQFHHGQLNSILLFLIVGAWAALRHTRGNITAGVLLGTAAAIKLFPGFLFLVLLLQRRRAAIIAGGLTVPVLTLVTLAVFGIDAYRDYVTAVLPTLVPIQSLSFNASLVGFWKKLFDSPGIGYMPVQPIADLPILATLGIALSAIFIVGTIAFANERARSADNQDQVFGLAIVGMLLLSPITWPHAFVLLILPLVLLAWRVDSRGLPVFVLCLMVLAARPAVWLLRFHSVGYDLDTWVRPSGAWLLVTCSIQFYALVGIFGLLATTVLREPKTRARG